MLIPAVCIRCLRGSYDSEEKWCKFWGQLSGKQKKCYCKNLDTVHIHREHIICSYKNNVFCSQLHPGFLLLVDKILWLLQLLQKDLGCQTLIFNIKKLSDKERSFSLFFIFLTIQQNCVDSKMQSLSVCVHFAAVVTCMKHEQRGFTRSYHLCSDRFGLFVLIGWIMSGERLSFSCLSLCRVSSPEQKSWRGAAR